MNIYRAVYSKEDKQLPFDLEAMSDTEGRERAEFFTLDGWTLVSVQQVFVGRCMTIADRMCPTTKAAWNLYNVGQGNEKRWCQTCLTHRYPDERCPNYIEGQSPYNPQ